MQDATRVIGYRHHRSHQAWFHYGTRRAPAHTAMVWNTLLTVLFVSGVAFCPQPGAAQPLIELMSVAIGGQSAEGNSNTPTPNANVSAVVFSSNAFNLVLPLEQNQQTTCTPGC